MSNVFNKLWTPDFTFSFRVLYDVENVMGSCGLYDGQMWIIWKTVDYMIGKLWINGENAD